MHKRSIVVGLVVGVRVASAQPDVQQDAQIAKQDTEVGVLPLAGGDTDNGFGLGAIGSYAKFDGHSRPYAWELKFSAFAATKSSPLDPSFEDAAVDLIVPQALDGRLRLEIRPSFTRETALHFYGVGNDIHQASQPDPDRDFYTRLHPQLAISTQWRLNENWSVLADTQYLYNQISYAENSTLAMQYTAIDPHARDSHSVLRLETGVVYDTRDNELAPNEGVFHAFKARVSPHMGDPFPYQYEQLDLQLRWYHKVSPRNVIALRAVGDVLIGDVPFYELARYEDTSAIGGGTGIRGVPAFTYYGKNKVFGNAELRTHVTNFKLWDKPFKFGVASFVDAGRLWSDGMDGKGLGIHWGVGGGIRLQQGRAFLVRADLAWSPDAQPVGGYVMADHMF